MFPDESCFFFYLVYMVYIAADMYGVNMGREYCILLKIRQPTILVIRAILAE